MKEAHRFNYAKKHKGSREFARLMSKKVKKKFEGGTLDF